MSKALEKLLNRTPDAAHPDLSLAATGRVMAADIKDKVAYVALEVPGSHKQAYQDIAKQLENKINSLWGVKDARVVLTASRDASAPTVSRETPPAQDTLKPAGVEHVIAVTSAKGGVGKSTITVLLAKALRDQGLRVGVLDADIYGPSVPQLLGVSGGIKVREDKKISPHMADGIKALSIGFMSRPEQASIWRGPMVSGAIQQFLRDGDWGDLDVLLIDTPPGTGDAHLTIAQKAGLSGVLVVTTPHQLAIDDTRRGINMFRKLDIPIFGIIENMAYFVDPSGQKHQVFGDAGADTLAQDIDATVIAQLPIQPALNTDDVVSITNVLMDQLDLSLA